MPLLFADALCGISLASALFAVTKSEKEIQYFLEIITCHPSIYLIDHADLAVSKFVENSIVLKKVKVRQYKTYLSKSM